MLRWLLDGGEVAWLTIVCVEGSIGCAVEYRGVVRIGWVWLER